MAKNTRKVTKKAAKSTRKTVKSVRKTVKKSNVLKVDSVKKIPKFELTLKNSKINFVLVYAEWCGACKMMHPDFESVAKKLGDSATFISVDTDKFDDLASTFGVDGLPTTVVIRTESGALNEESLTKLIQP